MINVTLGRLIGFVLVIAIAISVFASASRIPVGYTGVIVNMMGSGKGVQAVEEGTGWKFLTPNEELFKFPTFDQNVNLGEVQFQDKDGMQITVPVGITLRAQKGAAPMLFQTYRKSMDEIVGTNVPQVVRTEFNYAGATQSAADIYGPKKEAFIKQVEAKVRDHFAEKGIVVANLYINGQIGLPPNVITALNAAIEATQKTAQRENEVNQARAEADSVRAVAKGEKDAAISRAEGEAEAIAKKGKALRDYPEVLEWKKVETWDGKTPLYIGGSGPVPFIKMN